MMGLFESLPPPLPRRGEKSCCTCVRPLSEVPRYGEDEKKLPLEDRTLRCCRRVICGACIQDNARFAFYCPFCPDQDNFPGGRSGIGSSRISSPPTQQQEIQAEGESGSTELLVNRAPSAIVNSPSAMGKSIEPEDGHEKSIHHHIHPHETLSSVSVLYNMSPSTIRKANSLSPTGIDDRLLLARKTVLIPGKSKSLSSSPPGGDEAERRRLGIRRWMMATREPDYDIAKTYLEGAGWDVDLATDRWFGDSEWERTNQGPPKRGGGADGDGKKKGWLGFWGL